MYVHTAARRLNTQRQWRDISKEQLVVIRLLTIQNRRLKALYF